MNPMPLSLLLLVLGAELSAQCNSNWMPIPVPREGTDDVVRAMTTWDPDGAGPQPLHLVAGGEFQEAGGVPGTSRVGAMNLVTREWTALDQGLFADCMSLAVDGAAIFAGTGLGTFAFDGTSWNLLGQSSGIHSSLAVPSPGVLVRGGSYGVEQWDGTQWNSLGVNGWVGVLQAMPNGDLIAGGTFSLAGGVAVDNIARWDGSSWSALGGGSAFEVGSMTVDANGDLFACGDFVGGGTWMVSRWDGASWQFIANCPFDVEGLAAMDNGDVVAATRWPDPLGGDLPLQVLVGGVGPFVSTNSYADWQTAVASIPGGVAVGVRTSTPNLSHMFLWDGNQMSEAGAVTFGWCEDVIELANGDLLASFVKWGQGELICRYDGTTWTQLGVVSGGPVHRLVELPGGDLLVTGNFMWVDGVPFPGMARWDGASWTTMGSLPTWPRQAVVLANGLVIAATGTTGGSELYLWTGSAWSTSGMPVFPNVMVVTPRPDGGAMFWTWFGDIHYWDGMSPTTQVVGTITNGWLNGVETTADGRVLVLGNGLEIDGVPLGVFGLLDDGAWQVLDATSPPLAEGLVPTTDGRLVAYWSNAPASFTTLTYSYSSALDSWLVVLQGQIEPVAQTADNEFLGVPDQAFTPYRSVTPCASDLVATSSGCTGIGGAHEIVATHPWLGSTWRATASNLPSSAFVLNVFGFGASSLPLDTVFSQGEPGCTLLTTPDVVTFGLASNGAHVAELPFPWDTSLVGGVLNFQMVPMAHDPSLAITSVTATDMVTMTVGSF